MKYPTPYRRAARIMLRSSIPVACGCGRNHAIILASATRTSSSRQPFRWPTGCGGDARAAGEWKCPVSEFASRLWLDSDGHLVAWIPRLEPGPGGTMRATLSDPELVVPFKANQDRRHHIPKQRHQVTNWREYDAALWGRGSLTVWFTDAARQEPCAPARSFRRAQCDVGARASCGRAPAERDPSAPSANARNPRPGATAT